MRCPTLFLLPLLLLAIPACGQDNTAALPFGYDHSVNTAPKPVSAQPKRQYRFAAGNIVVDNRFEAARLNDARLKGNTLQLFITPENTPVNGSSWYAFRITAAKPQSLTIELHYTYGFHRYPPRISTDGRQWTPIGQQKIKLNRKGNRATFTLRLAAGATFIAAQEIVTSSMVYDWCKSLASQELVRHRVIGTSVLGRDIPCLDIYAGSATGKPIIAILGRQHPPEVTGHYALQHFVETLIGHENAESFFQKYRVLVFPIINPDGVDLGHWRHNAGGVDLNRDYAEYLQPEVLALTSLLVTTARENNARVLAGLDFHATYDDVFYTSKETEGVALAALKDEWLAAIGAALQPYDYKLKEEQHSVYGNPSAQHWFYHQFRALGITYEIGDNTDREFIKTTAAASANALIELLNAQR